MSKKACFVSDLHLLSRRSNGPKYSALLRDLAVQSDVFVFGGDVFDFKWSTECNLEESIFKARKWLAGFIGDFPHTQFIYLHGNHDCVPEFIAELENLRALNHRFIVEPYFVRLGGTVCLHGDVINSPTTQKQLTALRAKWGQVRTMTSAADAAYDLAVACRFHRVISWLANRQRMVADRLMSYLADVGQTSDSGVRRVVFGHTHQPMRFELNGIEFVNGGAAIRGVPFCPPTIEFTANPDFSSL